MESAEVLRWQEANHVFQCAQSPTYLKLSREACVREQNKAAIEFQATNGITFVTQRSRWCNEHCPYHKANLPRHGTNLYRYCAICGSVIPRKGRSPGHYKALRTCSKTCASRMMSDAGRRGSLEYWRGKESGWIK